MQVSGWFVLWTFFCVAVGVLGMTNRGIPEEIMYPIITGLVVAAMPFGLKKPVENQESGSGGKKHFRSEAYCHHCDKLDADRIKRGYCIHCGSSS